MSTLPKAVLDQALDTIEDASCITDADQLIVYVNAAFVAMTGYSEEESLGRNCRFLQHSETDPRTVSDIRVALTGGRRFAGEILNRRKDGTRFWNALTISPMRDATGAVTHFVSLQRDITMVVALETDSLRDRVTGLPNRVALGRRLAETIAAKPDGRLSIGVIDVDYFAQMSDSIGADAGDSLIKQIAHRVAAVVDPGDFLTHISGGVFVVLFNQDDPSGADGQAERLEAARRAAEEDFGSLERVIAVKATAAFVAYPVDGADEVALLRSADILLRNSKYAKPDVLSWWKQTPRGLTGQVPGSFAALSPHWHAAFTGDGLVLFVQPMVDLATGEVRLVESLARLVTPGGEVIAAGQFVPLLDKRELEFLFRFALDEALLNVARWTASGLAVGISVNLDPLTLQNPGCARWIRSALERHGVQPQLLTLELLETRAIDGQDQRTAIDTIQAIGVRLAIDDLGSGHSNLVRLADTDFDLIKIDSGILAGFRTRPTQTLSLLSALTRVSASLGRDSVVEGLETLESVEVAATLGATFGQGYYFAKPMPGIDFLPWHKSHASGGFGTAITTAGGALAYHWKHSDPDAHPGTLTDCPITGYLIRSNAGETVTQWHHTQHQQDDPTRLDDSAKLQAFLCQTISSR